MVEQTLAELWDRLKALEVAVGDLRALVESDRESGERRHERNVQRIDGVKRFAANESAWLSDRLDKLERAR